MKWLRRLLRLKCGGSCDWKIERGTVSNAQLRDYERIVGPCWELSTHYERTESGIVVYGAVCRKCGATKPVREADVKALDGYMEFGR